MYFQSSMLEVGKRQNESAGISVIMGIDPPSGASGSSPNYRFGAREISLVSRISAIELRPKMVLCCDRKVTSVFQSVSLEIRQRGHTNVNPRRDLDSDSGSIDD